jgi:hypothetical protein
MEKRWLYQDQIRHQCVRFYEAASLPAGMCVCLIGVSATHFAFFFAVGDVHLLCKCVCTLSANVGQQQVANTLFI